MTKCIAANYQFAKVKNHKVEITFNGGDISSDGGSILLGEADKRLSLISDIAKLFPDRRNPEKITHSVEQMLKQRVYGIALSYEDLNDHAHLRKCLAFQTTIGTIDELASSSTLCRLENAVNRLFIVEAHEVMSLQRR